MDMAKLNVMYFALARDAAGRERELVSIAGKATVATVLEQLVALHPGLGAMKRSIRLAVNHELADPDHRVNDGDEVGVLPPVAGG
ncbi:MAG: MoaD/ThiS family protein [Nitrososphaerales archaeon]|nr:MoaD/ThiS family protein [Nitrososphaerales archaeon]